MFISFQCLSVPSFVHEQSPAIMRVDCIPSSPSSHCHKLTNSISKMFEPEPNSIKVNKQTQNKSVFTSFYTHKCSLFAS